MHVMPPQFIPGLKLVERFYRDAVNPLLEAHFPGLPHAAARLGHGSDVLGFDTPMSMDHDWGLKLTLFLEEADFEKAESIDRMLGMELPFEFLGFPTGFTPPNHEGTAVMQAGHTRPLNHAVKVETPGRFFRSWMGWETTSPLEVVDWLSISAQTLRELTSGAVYHDGPGLLTATRQQLSWYPHDVWLYLLACSWQRIGQEEHLMPRAGYVGDELGSALIGSRLVRDIITLCFLMERQYPPYPKWLGTAFQQLACASALLPVLRRVQLADGWQDRQAALCEAYQILAHLHNTLGLTGQVSEKVQPFHDRPFKVIGGERFAALLLEQITDPAVLAVSRLGLVGSVDLFSDSTDLRAHKSWRYRLRRLLDPTENPYG